MGSESRSAFVDVLKVQKGVAQSLGLSQGASVGSGLPRNGAAMIDLYDELKAAERIGDLSSGERRDPLGWVRAARARLEATAQCYAEHEARLAAAFSRGQERRIKCAELRSELQRTCAHPAEALEDNNEPGGPHWPRCGFCRADVTR